MTSKLLPAAALTLSLGMTALSADARVKDEPMDTPHHLTDDLVLTTMDGKDFRLANYRGHRVLLVTWASW
ncbi:MAG: hypothetical protein AAF533_30760 [Acidobacteriota bacterium]